METAAPILLCYDDSKESQRAIETAAALFGNRRAIVLDVGAYITPAESLATGSPVAPAAAFEGVNTDDALHRARRGVQIARRAGFEKAEPRAELASPIYDGIVKVADEIDAAVIVMGSRGLNGLREAFEGSVSHAVAEHAGRPVLIVPPANDGR